MENYKGGDWKKLDLLFPLALSTAKNYPESTNFVQQLSCFLPSLVGPGFIKRDTVGKVCIELDKCSKLIWLKMQKLKLGQ
ncbi:MAG: hypothetical protein RDU30_11370 [Desulfovibrionaceae bacterium]|nr:hypothetical protein [Desulfovibrionaceae bacterium]